MPRSSNISASVIIKVNASQRCFGVRNALKKPDRLQSNRDVLIENLLADPVLLPELSGSRAASRALVNKAKSSFSGGVFNTVNDLVEQVRSKTDDRAFFSSRDEVNISDYHSFYEWSEKLQNHSLCSMHLLCRV